MTVSVDRLKPAKVDWEQPVEVAVPRRRGRPSKQLQLPSTHTSLQPQHTRSGRQVKIPQRYISVLEEGGVAA